MSPALSRRDFLKLSAVGGGGLVIGLSLAGCTPGKEGPSPSSTPPSGAGTTFAPNAYLEVDGDGTVTITAFRAEMGQGVRTAIAMIVAEELDADWSSVRVVQAGADPDYGDQVTGGSVSISDNFTTLRQAGGFARLLLVRAAAARWSVDAGSCRTEAGTVIHPDGEQRLSYGELAAAAAKLPQPGLGEIVLKDPGGFRIIGTRIPLVDASVIATGAAVYTSDVTVPGMVYAAAARPPAFGGSLEAVDDRQARQVPGVRDVVKLSWGVAVIGDDTWSAIRGRDALRATWNPPAGRSMDSAEILRDLVSQVGRPGQGAVYELPYYAHAPIEPMCCVADVRPDGCDVWAAAQDPQAASSAAAGSASLSQDRVTIHVPLLGGRFGRGLQTDFVEQAVELSAAIGKPVKLVWTREDDMRHDFYHPITAVRVSGSPEDPRGLAMDRQTADWAAPTGPWRAVSNVAEAFAHESFVDEIAAASGRDPVELRLATVREESRGVIRLAAEKAGWGTPLPKGWGRGIAYHSTWGATDCAEVAEVSVADDGTIRVHRVVCVVDCGMVVNPDTVEAQMEGGIVFGLTAALKDGITLKDGAVVEGNFDDYRLLRMDEMPAIEVFIVPSDAPPHGVGEMSGPPIAPAVANAVFAATGKRLRSLPLRLS
jgi:isoquinoline 1-oxidoreductase beta subunit